MTVDVFMTYAAGFIDCFYVSRIYICLSMIEADE
jgi:hypothetical protein